MRISRTRLYGDSCTFTAGGPTKAKLMVPIQGHMGASRSFSHSAHCTSRSLTSTGILNRQRPLPAEWQQQQQELLSECALHVQVADQHRDLEAAAAFADQVAAAAAAAAAKTLDGCKDASQKEALLLPKHTAAAYDCR
jgi:hypothetical protein